MQACPTLPESTAVPPDGSQSLKTAKREASEEYATATTPHRREQIIQLIDTRAMRAVVTSGDAVQWRQTFEAGTPVNEKAWTAQRGRATIVCTHHPVSARSNAHWDEIGRFIREQRQPR
jgi:hypothetical protein